MRLLLFTSHDELEKSLKKIENPHNFKIIRITSIQDMVSKTLEEASVCIIDDEGVAIGDLIKVVQSVKVSQKNQSYKTFFLLLTQLKSSSNFNSLVKTGIDGLLKKSLNYDEMAGNIVKYIVENLSLPNRRQFVRVKPGLGDKVEAMIFLPESKRYILGKVTDLSMGAMAVTFPVQILDQLRETSVFPNCCISLEEVSDINIHMKLVKKANNMAAFSYVEMKESFRDVLAQYIYQKLNPEN